MHVFKIPYIPFVLGVGGLIPFIGLCLIVIWPESFAFSGLSLERAALYLGFYGAIILSFIGGVRWGLAMRYEDEAKAQRDLVFSVIPALLGWIVLVLNIASALKLLCVLTIIAALFDYGLICRNEAPEWYGRLRLFLGAVASVALGLAGWSL